MPSSVVLDDVLLLVSGGLDPGSPCMQAFWVPIFCIAGTSFAMASASDVQDVVLNSVAIGFIFDVDEQFYALLNPAGTLPCGRDAGLLY